MVLNIAEIFYESGEIQYRYSRYLAIAAEGSYAKGVETGTWRYWSADGTAA
jgi:hypothetical protein